MKITKILTLLVSFVMMLGFASTELSAKADPKISEAEAYEIGIEAYLYFHPIITMDLTRKVTTNMPPKKNAAFAPMNRFGHARSFPDANFREVVRPNFDTLYSSAWIDLSKEPMIVTAPDTKGRYYVLPIYDMWTDVFASLGYRTTGTKERHFALVTKDYKGKLPKGVKRIESPTSMVWIINRIQTNGPKDYKFVNGLQDGFKVTPLSQWGKKNYKPAPAKIDKSVNVKVTPFDQITTMPADKYFAYGAELLKKYPPHLTDVGMMARLERIGIVQGKSYDLSKQPAVVQKALKRASIDGLKLMKRSIPHFGKLVNNWTVSTDTMGVYGNAYLKRATVTLIGLGALPAEDAVYPVCTADKDGNKIMGEHNYVLHFNKNEIPPANAFWSLTMYDEEGFQVPNKLNRFAIGDRDNLKFNKDGSLDLYIQHKSPGKAKESNWLPAPAKGALGITLRLYSPKAEVLDGRWVPPYIVRVK